MSLFDAAAGSSVAVCRARRLAATSRVVGLAAAVTRWPAAAPWLRETRLRIIRGVGGEWSREQEIRTVEQFDALVSGSVLGRLVASLVNAPIVAARDSAVRGVWDDVRCLELKTRVRAVGTSMIAAVLAHTALLAWLGVHVAAFGWIVRAVLLTSGVVLVRKPGAVAAAWRDKQSS